MLTGTAAVVVLISLIGCFGPEGVRSSIFSGPAGKLLTALAGPSLIVVAIALVRLSVGISDGHVSLSATDGWLPLRGAWLRGVLCLALVLLGSGMVLVGSLLSLATVASWFLPGM